MNNKLLTLLIGIGLVLVVASNTLFIIKQTERGVLLKFGEMVDPDLQPGLHVKVPFMHKVNKFDGRVLTLDAPSESFYTVENKRLIVDSFVKWRITDVATFYKATGGSVDVADLRLATRVNDGLRNEFGHRSVHEVVSGERDELMDILTKRVDKAVRQDLGIEVLDIRVKRIDLPEDVSESVYRRMAADREKEAREHRSQGKEQAEIIRADADRQSTVLEAEAYRESELLRGEGDAQAASVYAAAFSKDPEFFRFVRSLNAYKETFKGKDDLLVVDPKSDFFRYLDSASGK